MTSEEIKLEMMSVSSEAARLIEAKHVESAKAHLHELPLWEIAYQLAVMNESKNPAAGVGRNRLNQYRALDLEPAKTDAINPPEIYGFEPPINSVTERHNYRRAHEQNRFCGVCGAGEFHLIHPQSQVS